MIATKLILDLVEVVAWLTAPLRARRHETVATWARSGWFLICLTAGVLPTLAVILLVYLAIHLGG